MLIRECSEREIIKNLASGLLVKKFNSCHAN